MLVEQELTVLQFFKMVLVTTQTLQRITAIMLSIVTIRGRIRVLGPVILVVLPTLVPTFLVSPWTYPVRPPIQSFTHNHLVMESSNLFLLFVFVNFTAQSSGCVYQATPRFLSFLSSFSWSCFKVDYLTSILLILALKINHELLTKSSSFCPWIT